MRKSRTTESDSLHRAIDRAVDKALKRSIEKAPKSVSQLTAEQIQGEILGELSREQRTFILEKLVGLNDKDAAIAAGYSLSMAENTRQKIWARKGVREAFDQLRDRFIFETHKAFLARLEAEHAAKTAAA